MTKNCEYCKKSFNARDRVHKFCCTNCQQKSYKENNREKNLFRKNLIRAVNELEVTNLEFIHRTATKIWDENYYTYIDILMYLTFMCEDNNIKYTLHNLSSNVQTPVNRGIIEYTYPTIFLGENDI
jgi:hypothetical protein